MSDTKEHAPGVLPEEPSEYHGTKIATYVLEGIGVISIVLLAWFLGTDTHERSLNFLAALLGTSLGWAFAVLASPYSAADSAKFTDLSKTISLFFSGYLISKLDKVIEAAFQPTVIMEGRVLVRVLLFLTGLLVIGMGTLSSRLYINERRRAIANAVDPLKIEAARIEGDA